MKNILNKALIFFICLFVSYYNTEFITFVIITLVTLCFACLIEYFNKESLKTILFIGFVLLSIWNVNFVYYLPLILYDIILSKHQNATILAILPYIIHLDNIQIKLIVFYIIFFTIETAVKFYISRNSERIQMYVKQRDELYEKQANLEEKLKELADKQDIQTNIATLNERNRIAREIHDNVGHLLSSSIIQIGAIMTTTKEPETKASLEIVKKTLDKGMYSIRQSIHDLHNDSINLYNSLFDIVNNFTFCKINFTYQVNKQPPVNYCYAIIAIVKEALTNVIKHSNATKVTMKIFEHPKFYQIIIADNGTNKKAFQLSGMGIDSIKQRIDSLNGIVNIDCENGFRIFISLPKQKGSPDENNNN